MAVLSIQDESCKDMSSKDMSSKDMSSQGDESHEGVDQRDKRLKIRNQGIMMVLLLSMVATGINISLWREYNEGMRKCTMYSDTSSICTVLNYKVEQKTCSYQVCPKSTWNSPCLPISQTYQCYSSHVTFATTSTKSINFEMTFDSFLSKGDLYMSLAIYNNTECWALTSGTGAIFAQPIVYCPSILNPLIAISTTIILILLILIILAITCS